MSKAFNFENFKTLIFYIAVAFIAFDNLFFAPASGWATITPLILVLYSILNINCWINVIKKYWRILVVFGVILIFSFISYFTVHFVLNNVLNAFISIGLGAVCLVSLDIFFRQKKHTLNEIIPILIVSYSISMFFGIFQYIAIKGNVEWMIKFADSFSKRSYITANIPRVQFLFTEPSFITMHIFGVLLPIYLLTKDKKILTLMISFLILALGISRTVRLYLDLFVVIAIYAIIYVIKNLRKKSTIVLLLATTIVGGFSLNYLYNHSNRVHDIMTKGVYADGSLASRYFRVQSAIYGYETDYYHFLFGYGIGNALVPIRQGYERARPTYKNSFVTEVDQLGDPNHETDSDTICMYIRMISEFGFIPTLLLIYMIFRKSMQAKNLLMFTIISYLYIQFESYAFYGVWILIVANNYLISKKETIEKEVEKGNNCIQEDLVSIIIPIYNCAKYLKECLDSMVNQNYKNIEVILINDGSNDNSKEICEEYVNKFDFFKYFEYQNSGVSSARNNGINKANGKYIAFVDGDDYIDSTYISRLVYAVKTSGKDVGIAKYKRIYNKNIEEVFECDKEIKIENKNEYLKNILNVQTAVGMCTGKIYRTSIIRDNNIKFDNNLKVGEDALFNANICEYSNGCIDINDDLYNYRLNNESLVRKYDLNYKNKYYDAMVAMEKFCGDSHLNDMYNYIMYHVLLICVNYCCNPKNNCKYKERINNIRNLVKEDLFGKAIKNSNYDNLSLSRKITLFTLKHKLYWLTTLICDFRQKQFKRS